MYRNVDIVTHILDIPRYRKPRISQDILVAHADTDTRAHARKHCTQNASRTQQPRPTPQIAQITPRMMVCQLSTTSSCPLPALHSEWHGRAAARAGRTAAARAAEGGQLRRGRQRRGRLVDVVGSEAGCVEGGGGEGGGGEGGPAFAVCQSPLCQPASAARFSCPLRLPASAARFGCPLQWSASDVRISCPLWLPA